MSYMIKHYKLENNRAICSTSGIGIVLTEIKEETTCKKCILTLNRRQSEFKEKNRRLMSFIYLITAIIESIIYDYRADVLKEGHPLSMQTTLSTGVANGLLVVRSYNDCVKLNRGNLILISV